MAAVATTARTVLAGVALTAVVLLGLVAQAGSTLLTLPAPAAPAAGAEHAAATIDRFAAAGPHQVGVRRFDGDGTPLPLTVWYPSAPEDDPRPAITYSYGVTMFGPNTAVTLATYPGRATPGAEPDRRGGPYPLVVLSPGFAITSSSYAWLADHLASHGFVVVSPQHGESLDPQLLWRATVDRPRDVAAVLAYLDAETDAGRQFAGLIDAGAVAVIGHSYGGYTSLAAGGARLDTVALRAACAEAGSAGEPLNFQCDALLPHLADMAAYAGLDSVPEGRWPSWADPRVDAVVALAGDAVMFGPDGLAQISAPVLAIGGTADRDSPFDWGTAAAYTHAASPHKIEVALVGAEHLVFAGGCDTPRLVLRLASTGFCSDPAWDRQRGHDVVTRYTTAFLLAELAGDPAAAAALRPDAQHLRDMEYRTEGY